MPTFAAYGKYTSESVDAIRKTGHSTREAAATEAMEQLGGKVLAWYWLTGSDYDFVTVVDLPSSDELYALHSFSSSTGAFLKGEYLELRTSAQADEAIIHTFEWTPPGG